MGKALIVYGYYDEKDHYGALLDAIKQQLLEQDFDVEVANTFTFAKQHLANNEHGAEADTADWFRGQRTEENQALIKEEQDKILAATHIVFVYPIWWDTVPPMMGHWLSEVFRSVSFRVGSEDGKPQPNWGGERQAMIITTAGFNQEIQRDNFKKMLPQHNLDSLAHVLNTLSLDTLMNLGKTFPVTTALTYSGIPLTEQFHYCGTNLGDDPELLEQTRQAVVKFAKGMLEPEVKPLLLSGGYAGKAQASIEKQQEEVKDSLINPEKKTGLEQEKHTSRRY